MSRHDDSDKLDVAHKYISIFTPFEVIDEDTLAMRALDCGLNGYFSKNLQMHKLMERLKRALVEGAGVKHRHFTEMETCLRTSGMTHVVQRTITVNKYVLEENRSTAHGKVDIYYGFDSRDGLAILRALYEGILNKGGLESLLIPALASGIRADGRHENQAYQRLSLVAKKVFSMAVGYKDYEDCSRTALVRDCFDGNLIDPSLGIVQFAMALYGNPKPDDGEPSPAVCVARMIKAMDPEHFNRLFHQEARRRR